MPNNYSRNDDITFPNILEKVFGLKDSFGLSVSFRYDIMCYLLGDEDFRRRLSEKDKTMILRTGKLLIEAMEPYDGAPINETPAEHWIKFNKYLDRLWRTVNKYMKPKDLERTDFLKQFKV